VDAAALVEIEITEVEESMPRRSGTPKLASSISARGRDD
jgi:hypothetical protein